MGLLDVFSRKSPVERARKDLCEPYAQPDYRRAAMTKLLDIGTAEAYEALLKRFTFNASGHIADEEEKRELVDLLVAVGEPVIEPIKRFIAAEKAIGFAIRVLVRILDHDAARGVLKETLATYEPLDHRSTEAKRALVHALAEFGVAEDAERLVPYLDDHHDDVQVETIDAIERLGNPQAAVKLIEVVVGERHSGRVQRHAAQALVALEVTVGERYAELNSAIRAEFVQDKRGCLVRKAAHGVA